MKYYWYYSRHDKSCEALGKVLSISRYRAAEFFSIRKCLSLKSFLKLYGVGKTTYL